MERQAIVAEHEVEVPAAGVTLPGSITVPASAVGVVAFAHGSGSSRHSPRNRAVAARLHESRLATLLFDLLTADENDVDCMTGEYRFDIPLLAGRLTAAIEWLVEQDETHGLPVGLFGASTGAAAALMAAAERPAIVGAVVSRGGRPDLARGALSRVHAPTLFVVGGLDTQVIELNKQAGARLQGIWELEIIAGATHLFAEPGALEKVSLLAAAWFRGHLLARRAV